MACLNEGTNVNDRSFEDLFPDLTGLSEGPLAWQRRLYAEFLKNIVPPICDLPTGMGKTAIIPIWLIALAHQMQNNCSDRLPMRLVYVVDRRTVVDQATRFAEKIKHAVDENPDLLGTPVGVSTLRGQLADNREWSRDPSRPAIVIGTVDLIGSGLLFSGYRSSYKRRPLEAGLLGQDSLLVLDEAHLSKPFEKLIQIVSDEGPFQSNRQGERQGRPMRVMRMSATSGGSAASQATFTLQLAASGELAGEDATDSVIAKRFGAKKNLRIMVVGEKEKPVHRLAEAAIELAAPGEEGPHSGVGKRIVIFTRKPEDARSIADIIRQHGSKKNSPGPYADAVEVLTGTMRGLERDELVGKPVFRDRWLNGNLKPDAPENQTAVFLVSTSAGEVGFDLNADHLVGDAAPLDSWIQRLGRVNRRGEGEATVILVSDSKPADKTDLDKACIAATKMLIDHLDGKDVGPKSLALFKASRTEQELEAAISPKPTTVELTDVLLDSWSMTSIVEPMPGRPPVGPWLRGTAEWEPPQTTIAWRLELDEPGFGDLDLDHIEDWFDTHRVLTHETLTVTTSDAAAWLKQRWDAMPEIQRRKLEARPVVIDRAGIEVVRLGDVISRVSRKAADSDVFLRGADIIIPASFGGIRRGVGLLDHTHPRLDTAGDNKAPEERAAVPGTHQDSGDVADIAPGVLRQRIIETTLDGEKQAPRIIGDGGQPKRKALLRVDLASEDDMVVRLVSYVSRREKQEYGSEPHTLQQHVGAVRKAVDALLERLDFLKDNECTIITCAAQLAADYHDHGKNRERWQRLLVFPKPYKKPDEPMGKSGGEMKRDPRGYRHEFGSLRECIDSFKGKIDDDALDLAMHLIATHHGRGRPHFPNGAFDPDAEDRSDDLHADTIRRFARLQRKYGWWRLAWMENLLRCADAMASSAQASEHEPAVPEGDAA